MPGSALKIRADLLEAFLEFREVRPGPIDLTATRATPEFFVINFRKRFEPLNYFGLGNLSQGRIAAEASRKWGDGAEKIKAANYFDRLFTGVLRTRAVTGFYYRMHEQTPIACQERSIFTIHYLKQLPIFRRRIVSDIETEQAQIARECSKMSIQDKSINFSEL